MFERDGGKCVICGTFPANPCCHIVSRAKGGLGVETNIVTLCDDHHRAYDNGGREAHDIIDYAIVGYMKSKYGEDWKKENQFYRKWGV